MQNSRVQLGLMAAMALGLGFSLSSSDAIGYPGGSAVSLGQNPVWSMGGDMRLASHSAVTAEGGDLVIKDISLSSNFGGWWRMKIRLSDGTPIANFSGEDSHTRPLNRTFAAGLRIPEGQSLVIDWEASYGPEEHYRYTLAGFIVQP